MSRYVQKCFGKTIVCVLTLMFLKDFALMHQTELIQRKLTNAIILGSSSIVSLCVH